VSNQGRERVVKCGNWRLEAEPAEPEDVSGQVRLLLSQVESDSSGSRLYNSLTSIFFCGLFMQGYIGTSSSMQSPINSCGRNNKVSASRTEESAVNKPVLLDSTPGFPFLRVLPYLVVAWCIGWMAYGFFMYPNAPIKPCGNSTFCDKRHTEHTKAEYEQFSYWEMVLVMSWPFGMVSGYVIRRRKRPLAIIEE
jgi:hypothetical protein